MEEIAKGFQPANNAVLSKSKRDSRHAELINFDRRFVEILQTFYASAFTMLVYKRGLCPKEGFKVETKLGIKVPWFVHPSSLDYVKEVSEKIVFFMKKNILEGAVLHVMIWKDKKPYAIQRFVFKSNGGFDLNEFEQFDSVKLEEMLESMTSECVSCLLDIRKSEMSEIDCPWFSRWSVSIGIKKQFLSMCPGVGLKGPFTHDPNRVYFPWKKRARQGKISKLTPQSQSLKISIRKKSEKSSPIEKLQNMEQNVSVINVPGSPDMFENEDVNSQTQDLQSDGVEELISSKESQAGQCSPSSTLDQMEYLSSSEEDFETDGIGSDDKKSNSLHPMSSFQIIRGLMINVYHIDYPFDIQPDMVKASKKAEEKLQLPDDEEFV